MISLLLILSLHNFGLRKEFFLSKKSLNRNYFWRKYHPVGMVLIEKVEDLVLLPALLHGCSILNHNLITVFHLFVYKCYLEKRYLFSLAISSVIYNTPVTDGNRRKKIIVWKKVRSHESKYYLKDITFQQRQNCLLVKLLHCKA